MKHVLCIMGITHYVELAVARNLISTRQVLLLPVVRQAPILALYYCREARIRDHVTRRPHVSRLYHCRAGPYVNVIRTIRRREHDIDQRAEREWLTEL